MEEEVISKIPCGWEKEWKAFIFWEKFKKMVISKSVHKRWWSTRKLASNLTIQSPKCSKDTVHGNLRFNLRAYSCKRPVLRKISKIRQQITSVFQEETGVYSLKTWGRLYLHLNVQYTCQCLELTEMTVSGQKIGQKWNQIRSPSYL